jgi:hypothetical protein
MEPWIQWMLRPGTGAASRQVRGRGLEPLQEYGKSRGYRSRVPGETPRTPPVVPGGDTARGGGKKRG